MKAVKTVGKVLLSPIAAVTGAFKTPKLPSPSPVAVRDDVLVRRIAEDRLGKRRGGLVDLLTGTGGAEAAPAAGASSLLGN